MREILGRLRRGSFVPRGQIPGVRPRGQMIRDPLDDYLESRGVPIHDRRAAGSELSGYLTRGRRSG